GNYRLWEKVAAVDFQIECHWNGSWPNDSERPGRVERRDGWPQVVHLERDGLTRNLRQQADVAHPHTVKAAKTQRLRWYEGFQQRCSTISGVDFNTFNTSSPVEKD